MPTVEYPGFVGPSNVEFSINLDDEQSINLFPHEVNAGTPKAKWALYGTPGTRVYTALADAPIRALFYQDGRAFCVSGSSFYEIFPNKTSLGRGLLHNDYRMATIDSNGQGGDQLFVVSGGLGYVYDLSANTLTQIADPDFPANAGMGFFVDGYFGVTQQYTAKYYISALEDGTSWDGLDVAQLSEGSDNLQAAIVNHREIWLLGTKSTEVWYDAGLPDFPFAPIQGVFIEQGCLAPFSVKRLADTVIWVGLDERGAAVVYAASGYTPKAVSTLAVSMSLSSMPRLSEAVAWTYQEQGHLFWLLWVPDSDTTWVYDATTNVWHERRRWDPVFKRWLFHRGRTHMYAFGKHLVGDYGSAAIYDLSLNYYDDEVL